MKVTIPDNINEIKVKHFTKLQILGEDATEADLVSIFCEVPLRIVNQMPIEDVRSISNDILLALDSKSHFSKKFTLNGVKYGFIPNLEKITTGEYIDLQNYLSNQDDLHKAAAVMFRPITKEYGKYYDIEPYTGANADEMKDAPLGVINGALVFFYDLVNELLMHTQTYSQAEMEEKLKTFQQADNSPKDTDGLTHFTPFVMETLRSLMQ